MFGRRAIALSGLLAVIASGLIATSSMVAQAGETAGVTTAGYYNLRDDWDPNEPALSPSAVQSASFGKLFSTKLNGSIYAQPLVYGGNVIVTTEKANAYGVNATTGAIVWRRSFGSPVQGQDDRLLGPDPGHRLDVHPGDRPGTGTST